MEYSKNGKVYEFDYILSNEDLQLFINGKLDGTFIRDDETIYPKNPNWTGFKNAIFLENFAFLNKCLDCRTYSLLSGIILSAETGAVVHEENFLKVFRLLKADLQKNNTAMTTDEITFINQNLALYDFSITI
jgi:hypothetical protein